MRAARWTSSAVLLLALAGAVWAQAPVAPTPPTRFVQVDLKILTTGEKQPVREVGAFTASLPLGKAGRLARAVEIASESKGIKTSAELHLVLTPSLDEAGLLHCFAVSEALLPGGNPPESRAKDLTFPHSGSQLMEVFADPATKVRVILSVSARLQETPQGPPEWPVLHFGLRVEQWAGARRDEVEALQLQSLEGRAVSHEYTRRVPRVVEGREGDLVLDDLPVIKPGEEGQALAAGQGFSIPLGSTVTASEGGEGAEGDSAKGGGSTAKPKRDSRVPKAAPPPSTAPSGPKSLVWDEEYYRITLAPLQLSAGGMRLRVTMRGRVFDPDTGALMEELNLQQEKEILSGQPVPFYLTTEKGGGPIGFVAWVLPAWGTPGAEPLPQGVSP